MVVPSLLRNPMLIWKKKNTVPRHDNGKVLIETRDFLTCTSYATRMDMSWYLDCCEIDLIEKHDIWLQHDNMDPDIDAATDTNL